MIEGLAMLYVIGLLFLVVLAICWIILPFALIGTKPLLRELIREQKRTNTLLESPRETPVVLVRKGTT